MENILARIGIQDLYPGMRVSTINRYSSETITGIVIKVTAETKCRFIDDKPVTSRHVTSVTIADEFSDEERVITENDRQYEIHYIGNIGC